MNRTKAVPHSFSDSGISVKDSITLATDKKISHLRILIVAGITLLGLSGSIMSFLSFYDFDYDRNMLLIYNALFFIVFSVIFNLPNRWKLLIIPVCVLFETVFVRMRDEFVDGYKAMYNVMSQKLKITGEGISYYRINENVDIEEVTTIFFLFACCLFALFVCYSTYCSKSCIPGIIATFIPLEFGFYFGLKPSYPACIMVVAYWVALMSMSFSGAHSSDYMKDAGFIRRENDFFAKSHIKFRVGEITGFIAVAVTFAVFGIILLAAGISGYERSETLDEIRSNVKKSVSEFSVDNIPASMSRIATSFGNFSISPGMLGQFSSVSYNNETDLVLSFDNKLSSEMYIKSFAGSYYTGKSWEDFPKNIYKDNSELFNSFENKNMYPQDFLNVSLSNFRNSIDCNVRIKSLMKNTRYIYSPYGSDNSGFEKIKDNKINAENKDEYSIDFRYSGSYENFLSSVQLAETGITNSQFRDMTQIEEQYRQFVENEYLQLPDNEYIQQLRDEFSELIQQAQGISQGYSRDDNSISTEILYDNTQIYSVLYKIRNLISADTEYTLSPGRTPSNRDFVNYFLLENKKGYCSHYATAGVVLARMCGIPARYAEGYIITADDFTHAPQTADGRYSIEVKDSRAHAWAEIYIEGLGWIPFEFTPGYDSGVVAAETSSPEQTPQIIINETVITETVTETTVTQPPETFENTAVQTQITEVPQTQTAEDTMQEAVTEITESDNGGTLSAILDNRMLRGALLIIIAIVMICALIFAVIVLRRFINVRKREKSLNGRIRNQNAVNAYIYILELLSFAGIRNNSNMSYMDFAEYAEENSEFFREGEFISATRTALKSDMSQHKISKKESDEIVMLAENLAEKILENSDSRQRFKFRYIYNFL